MKNPIDLPGQVLSWADSQNMLPAGSVVLCALSGGADSMAMLTCLLEAAQSRRLTILAAHYNHQLRGAESQRDEDFVRAWCESQNISLTLGRGDVRTAAAQAGSGLEETARAMRYAFLADCAETLGATAIATAHNADDNAETLLLHLVRGTGLDGLTGIPPRRGLLIRPLLSVSRQQIQDYLTLRGVPHVEDSSNADPAYARNRLRLEVMPVLRDLNPGFSQRLSANLTHLRADRDYLEAQARPVSQKAQPIPGGLSLSAKELASLPRPIAIRVVKQLLAQLGRHQISAVHLDQALALAESPDPSAAVPLPRGLRLRRVYDTLLFQLAPPPADPLPTRSISSPGIYELGPWRLALQPVTCPAAPLSGPYQWDLKPAAFPLEVRPRRKGDLLRLAGRPEKTLKKWYIDEKIPRELRDILPVLTDKDGLLAVCGLGPEASRRAIPGEPALRVTVTKTEREKG